MIQKPITIWFNIISLNKEIESIQINTKTKISRIFVLGMEIFYRNYFAIYIA